MGLFTNRSEEKCETKRGFFYTKLPKNLQCGYDAAAAGIQAYQKRIHVPSVECEEDIELIVNAIRYDLPSLFFCDFRKIKIWSGATYTFSINYLYDKRRAVQIKKEIEEKAGFIISQYIEEDMSDYEKCLAIHDYITENIRYNFSALSVDYVYDAFTVEGTLIKHQAVCEGIAKGVAFLLNKIGITCITVSGKSDLDGKEVAHAWNIVEINQKFYHIDATWDLQEVNHFTNRSHMYMNLDDESILMNHSWDLQKYPTCNSKLENYYVKEKRYFRTIRSFQLFVQKFLQANLTYMDIRFDDTLDFPDITGVYLEEVIQKEALRMGKNYRIMFLFNDSSYVFQAEIVYE